MPAKWICSLAFVFIACVATAAEKALPFVSPMFGDNMVLQRGKKNTIWGWSKPGEVVRVEINGKAAKTKTGSDGRWEVKIRPPAVGGPYTVKIIGTEKVELHDVLVGDVWLCGGQSNMELPIEQSRNGADEVKAADHPDIRFFVVKNKASYSPAALPEGKWKVCSPKSVTEDGGLSAVAYFFARRVQKDIHVPIGLIQDCLGGTTAETWTSPETLRKLKDFDAQLAETERLKAKGGEEYGNYIMHWYDEYDVGLKGKTWADVGMDDSTWKPVQLLDGFKELGVADVSSVCWFRKEVVLPDPLPAGKVAIHLGVIERMDTAYINGKWVGASAWVENPRVYAIKGDILKPGTNVITVRVFKTKPKGGFLSEAKELKLKLGDGTTIPLAGEWRGMLSVDARPPHPLPRGFENWPVMPSVLYQGRIQPVAPLAITGALWYQGEGNAERAYQYRRLLPAMIGDWRKLFGQGDFPFYIVSLPGFMQHQNHPVDADWAELREAQALTAKSVRNSALAVAIDTGDANNIHPADKKVVGERLAYCALAKHYGKKVVCEGPTFKSMKREGGALRLSFDHTDGGLVVKGDKLEEFAISGKDRKWYWADAKGEGDAVVVSSPKVPEPVAARYAWQSFPAATLYNGAGLPAVPFRTDDWPGITDSRK